LFSHSLSINSGRLRREKTVWHDTLNKEHEHGSEAKAKLQCPIKKKTAASTTGDVIPSLFQVHKLDGSKGRRDTCTCVRK
jgi:hypothetical protein